MKSVQKILFATHNKNKIREIQAITPDHIRLLSLEELNIFEELPETSATIEENSAQKANYAYLLTGTSCFAEDTGLEVEALDNAPGVYSARYAGEQATSEQNIDKLLLAMHEINLRKARFKTIISFRTQDALYQFEGVLNGTLTRERKGSNGFGYDSVFIPEGLNETLAEMEFERKNELSHRKKAFVCFLSFLTETHIID